MPEILSSKKFIPVYFIVGTLSIIFFWMLDFPWLSIMLLSGSCFIPGIVFLGLHEEEK
ncbi:hypothetical protein [Jeotgalibacillus sp. S-D1]|uniref:hypothetical protein n=1 Tax=Jeotgalibacillus sp. S-D1 TaxID=2552189 RepID=UPI00140472A3|nr:hypothetical protein [Jeotgalibacillus sp. S-D1]